MSLEVTRQQIRDRLNGLPWGVDEDAEMLIDLLLESYTLTGVFTWIFFYNTELDGTPLALLEDGRSREVFREARRLVSVAAV